MDKLWAPWRSKYITTICKGTKKCIFCSIFKDRKDAKNYVFARATHSYAVLNIFPYNNGHVLIVPNKHVDDFDKLNKEERDDLIDLLEKTKALVDKVLSPEGYNIGINLGKAAGAGFPGHLHIHLVPRWVGDVNFMPVVTDTKVVSQSLETLYRKLKDADTKTNRRVRR